MTSITLEQLSEVMREIDFCMLSTRSEGGQLASRPMSNNGDVEYDGDSWFFSYEDTKKILDIVMDANVSLTLTGEKTQGRPGMFIAIQGEASLIKDRSSFDAHWANGLQSWFPEGVDTPGLILIKVHASRIQYWDGGDQGEINLKLEAR